MSKNTKVLDEKWIKASIIGTTWAASEIVLGSFLHNLKVPFSGNALTAIGIIILISASYIWKEKGLFWRAGLICAIMKTMSPSAVIFGPMIAIFSQSLLLKGSVRIFGKTIIGYAIGSILAMSWNLFQKIINFIIFYGMNIVEVYESLLQMAQKQLYIQFNIVWLPIIILLVIYAILGLFSAYIGIKVGRKIKNEPVKVKSIHNPSNFIQKQSKANKNFKHSLVWLFIDILLIISSLYLLSKTHWLVWSSIIILVVSIWALRYKRALKQLLKPKFWVFFVLITMLTAYVFTKIQGQSIEEALLTGLQMNFRAIVIIIGFSVLGTELYNPKIQAFFLKTSFKQLPLALELSFESLPLMIASIPNFKSIVKNPISIISEVISQAEFRLDEIKKKLNFKQQLFIITGSIEEGKTTAIKNSIEELQQQNITIGGFYSPRIIENNITIGYDIVAVQTLEKEPFLRISTNKSLQNIGKYSILEKGLQKGIDALKPTNNLNNKIVVIDEVGRLELNNKGWAKSIQELVNTSNNHILITVRDHFLEKVLEKWNFKNHYVFDVSKNDYKTISNTILEKLKT